MKTLLRTTYFLSMIAWVGFMSACSTEMTDAPQPDMQASYKMVNEEAASPEMHMFDDQGLINAAPKKGSSSIAAIAIDNDFDELVAALVYVDEEEGTSLVDLFMNDEEVPHHCIIVISFLVHKVSCVFLFSKSLSLIPFMIRMKKRISYNI